MTDSLLPGIISIIPGIEIDKQIDQLLRKSSDIDSADTTTDTWDPSVREYVFVERARIADGLFRP